MEATFQDVIAEERERGRTILLSSHILAEAEALCDRVTIVRAGAAVETGALADLRHLTRTGFRVATTAGSETIAALPGVHDVRVEAGQLAFDVDTDALAAVLSTLATAGVASLTVAPPSLEELFLRHYGAAERLAA
jgi:ABC-2 type transport system ATP-binding protein